MPVHASSLLFGVFALLVLGFVYLVRAYPDAEEIVVVTRGSGTAQVGDEQCAIAAGDVVYVPPATEHEFRNTADDLLGVLFINVPTGEGLRKLAEAQAAE